MKICCLDLEGVLLPEMWIAVAKHYKLSSLKLTTRDIPNYDKLMHYRLGILKKEGLRLQDIQRVIGRLKPLPGAKAFLKKLQAHCQVIILSDTFAQFPKPLMRQLDYPTLFCNDLKVSKSGVITGYRLRQKDGKKKAVKALKSLAFHVVAAGDSYNDLTMLQEAHRGILFRPPTSITKKYKRFPVTQTYPSLLRQIIRA